MFGLLTSNQFDQRVYLEDSRSDDSDKVISYTPPEDKFVQFMSTTSLLGTDFYHQSISTHAAYDVDLLNIGLSVAHKENGTVTLSTASDLTVMLMGFEHTQEANDYWWHVYAQPGVSRQVHLPKLPTLIMDALEIDDISSELMPNNMSGSSYGETPRYADWIEAGAKRSHDRMEFYRSPVNIKSLTIPLE